MRIDVSYFREGDGYRAYMGEIPGFSAAGRTIEEARQRLVELMARTIEQGREECQQRMKARRVKIAGDEPIESEAWTLNILPPFLLRGAEPSIDDAWRRRLRGAIRRTGRKHSDVASGAGVTPVTLSRILNEQGSLPYFQTVTRIAWEVGVSVGWLLNETEFRIGMREREELYRAARSVLALAGDGVG